MSTKIEKIFQHLVEQMFYIMINTKQGSTKKSIVEVILSKTKKTNIVRLYYKKIKF